MKIKLTILAGALFIFYALYSNVYFLSSVACRHGNMSSTYEFLLERIYKIISSDEEGDYLKYLDEADNKYFHTTWLRILSVSGVENMDKFVFNDISETDKNDYSSDLIYHYLISAGKSDSVISIPLLKSYLDSDDSDGPSKMFSAGSMYLLNGTLPSKSDDYYFVLSEKQYLAREAILNSRGRRRTYDEMITIDQPYRRTEIIVHEE